MKKQNASIDSSFWIDIYKIGLTEEVLSRYNIIASRDVYDEVMKSDLVGIAFDDAELFGQLIDKKIIKVKHPKKPLSIFGPGEASCLALGTEHACIVLIDDYKPYVYAQQKLGLKAVSSLDFSLYLYKNKKINKRKLLELIQKLPGVSKNEKVKLLQKIKKGGVQS